MEDLHYNPTDENQIYKVPHQAVHPEPQIEFSTPPKFPRRGYFPNYPTRKLHAINTGKNYIPSFPLMTSTLSKPA